MIIDTGILQLAILKFILVIHPSVQEQSISSVLHYPSQAFGEILPSHGATPHYNPFVRRDAVKF